MDTALSLRLLQQLWLGVAGALAVITMVPVIVGETATGFPVALTAALAAAGGAGAIVGVMAIDRTFAATPPADDQTALTELRTRAFLQVAIAEAPLLLAFALAFVLGPSWVAVIGGAAGLLALAVARPTRSRIAGLEAAWHRAGHDVSALRAADLPDSATDLPESAADGDDDHAG